MRALPHAKARAEALLLFLLLHEAVAGSTSVGSSSTSGGGGAPSVAVVDAESNLFGRQLHHDGRLFREAMQPHEVVCFRRARVLFLAAILLPTLAYYLR